MEFRKITAIIQVLALKAVEQQLIAVGVSGVTVTRVKGYGEYADYFTRDLMTQHVRIEIFTHTSRVSEIRDAIFDAASTGSKGDGIIAVLPVECVYHIRNRSAVPADQPSLL